jgi:Tfp pilus assembly protein FimT
MVLTISSLVLAIAVPRGQRMLDRISVQAARGDVLATLDLARALAIAGNSAVAVAIDSVTGTLRIRRGVELFHSRSIGGAHGVRVGCSRDSLTYDGRGLGRGAANLSILLRRGAAAETVFVSRLGRAR